LVAFMLFEEKIINFIKLCVQLLQRLGVAPGWYGCEQPLQINACPDCRTCEHRRRTRLWSEQLVYLPAVRLPRWMNDCHKSTLPSGYVPGKNQLAEFPPYGLVVSTCRLVISAPVPNIEVSFFYLSISCPYFKKMDQPGASGDYRKYPQVLTVSLRQIWGPFSPCL